MQVLDNNLESAGQESLPRAQWRVLVTNVLGEMVDVFRLILMGDPPVQAVPMTLKGKKPHAQAPNTISSHPYPLEKSRRLSRQVELLERTGLIYRKTAGCLGERRHGYAEK